MISLQVYIVCLGLLVLITAGIAYRAFSESRRQGTYTFGFLISTMTIWALFYLLEIVSPDLSHKTLARKTLYLGMTMSGPFWLAFALRFTALSEWWSKYGRNALLAIPGMIAFLLGLTNEMHHLIWQALKMPNGNLGPLEIVYGPAFWIHTTIAYLFIGAGVVIYLYVYLHSPKYLRKQTGIILLGVLITALTNLFFLMGVFPANVDPTPFSFAVSAPLLALGFFRFGVFNLFPIAAPVVVENLRDAVIVVDEENRVTNINRAAKKWFDLHHNALGMPVFDILPKPAMFKDKWDTEDARVKFKIEADQQRVWYDAAITLLYRKDKTLLGRVVVIHDVTHEQELLEAEFRHSTRMGLLEEIGRQISVSLTEKEILQNSVDTLVNHFGYAEAAISLLTKDNDLEVAAIAGTQDFGYKPSFKQKWGSGIIGHTAKARQTYIASDVSKDPYYFSSAERYGSAVCIPLINEKNLLGVIYVESAKPNAFSSEDVQMLETLASQVASAMRRARLYADTQEHLRVMSAVQSISQVISSSLELEKICTSVIKVLNVSFGYTYISIYFLENDYLHLVGQYEYPEELIFEKIHVSEGICGRAVKSKKTQFVEDVIKEPEFLRASPHVTSEICVPLLKENLVLGVLDVEGKKEAPLSQKDADMLDMLAGPIALAVDNARLHAQVKVAAMTDAVSGLSNRHAFEETLRTEIERATRSGAPLSLLIFDIDSFKDYNDTWGHPAGDARLRATADLIRKNLRKYDVAARYGGDEFAIILPDTDQEGSILFAKRLLAAAEASAPQPVPAGKTAPGYTLSIGVATFPHDGNTFETLVVAADHAELIAKRFGKNRIFIARDLDK